jgi:hypothetical protein
MRQVRSVSGLSTFNVALTVTDIYQSLTSPGGAPCD